MEQKYNHFRTILIHVVLMLLAVATEANYKVGVGRADCTGPSAEITFMGYAKTGQRGCGIHLRQFSRAFIFDDGKKKAAFVTVDACMMNHGVKDAVLQQLENSTLKGVFKEENLILSGTHTHAGPGGFLMNVMLDIPDMGFVTQTFDALVTGIVKSLLRANSNIKEAKIFVNDGELLETNINRSPASYLYNPQEERDRFNSNTDTEMVQLKIVDANDKNNVIGAINWFAVHPTSMSNTNCLISSDNVGFASILLEQKMDPSNLPGETKFVGAFASTNLGDVSPNIKGPFCLNTGEPCETVTSTCNMEAKQCVGRGPGKDEFESTKIIATNMFQKAVGLLSQNKMELTGDVKFIHQFVHMPSQEVPVTLKNGTVTKVKGCLPAMGVAFAAGTTDGVGEFNFHQASNTTDSANPFWYIVRDFVFPPTPEDVACHAPKPILIMSGRIKLPYEWQPEVVSLQYIQIGNFIITAVPGEFTTMSGRRLRQAITKKIVDMGGNSNSKVVIAGLSNVYTNYIATPEEYQLQRYEGASTIFGPNTLPIYLHLYETLAENLMKDLTTIKGPLPFKFPQKDQLLTLNTPVMFDSSGWFNNFGDCIQQPPLTVEVGQEVSVKFVSGHPQNNLKLEETFLTVEKKSGNNWKVVATDASWETKFIWKRTHLVKGSSEVEIIWSINNDTEPGIYRIRHFGDYKYIFGGIYSYEGKTEEFEVKQK